MRKYVLRVWAFVVACTLLASASARADILGPLTPRFFPEGFEGRVDTPALQSLWGVMDRRFDGYTEPNAKVTSFFTFRTYDCINVADALARDFIDEACPGATLEGWQIHTATTNGPCHDAVIVISPPPPEGQGVAYLFDPYVNGRDIVELDERVPDHFHPLGDFEIFSNCPPGDSEYFETLAGKDRPVADQNGNPTERQLPEPVSVVCRDGRGVSLVSSPPETAVAPPMCVESTSAPAATLPVRVVVSRDPNDKSGSLGSGAPSYYVAAEEPLRYTIAFENVETASAPAQEVIITDQLDVDTMDLEGFSLGPVTFGETIITPPGGLAVFSTQVDLRPESDLVVEVTGSLDAATGMVSWKLRSVDPVTGELPEDPLAGFLPPNLVPPEGDGSVAFSVDSLGELATGTEIRNGASIVFDTNAAIITPEWLNTVDATPPESEVSPLAGTQHCVSFFVGWTGSDDGSGIGEYQLFASEDDGQFESAGATTSPEGAYFTGTPGSSYGFYTVATDRVGNKEVAPGTGDASTTIALDAASALSTGQQKCVTSGNRDLLKIHKLSTKQSANCLKNHAQGRALSKENPAIDTLEECLTDDPKGKLAKAQGKVTENFTKQCGAPPDGKLEDPFPCFGVTDATTVVEAARTGVADLVHDVFGPDLDLAGLATEAINKNGAVCQLAVWKAVVKCQEARLKEFEKCTKLGLKGKTPPGLIDGAEVLRTSCLGLGSIGQPDLKGKIAKRCSDPTKGIAKVLAKKCVATGQDLAALVPTCQDPDPQRTARCLGQKAACRVCRAINGADALDRDCDAFDNGVEDGTCS